MRFDRLLQLLLVTLCTILPLSSTGAARTIATEAESQQPQSQTQLDAHADAAAGADIAEELWYVLEMDSRRAGWVHAKVETIDNHYHQHVNMQFKIRRGAVVVNMNLKTLFVETVDGKPVKASTITNMAMTEIRQDIDFTGDAIVLTTTQGEQSFERTFPHPQEEWLPPVAAARHVEQQIASGEKNVSFHTMDPSSAPAVFKITRTLQGEENIDVFGKTIPATLWISTTSQLPGDIKEYYDEQGNMVRTLMNVGGMSLTILLADEKLAKMEIEAPEMVANLLVTPDQKIRQPRQLTRGVYRLSVKDDGKGDIANLPQTGHQHVERIDDKHIQITVDLNKPVDAGDDKPTDDHLAATSMINHEDEIIRSLVEKAFDRKNEKLTDAQKAEKMRRYVHRYVRNKTLGVGNATASEVARTRTGDCTEHAVLLAAMLRAADIPSRTASGLVYADEFIGSRDIFGYHMWTQAWIANADLPAGGQWIDLDAAFSHPYDATHITTQTSAMLDGSTFNDAVDMLPLFGRLRIEVLETASSRPGAGD